MSPLLPCLRPSFPPQLLAILEVLGIYLVLVALAIGFLLLIEPISSLEELDYEFREFVDYYKETSWWWLTTFFTALLALTVGASPGLLVDLAFLSIFTLPALIYFYRGYPFSLKCEYRSRDSSGRTAITEEKEGFATLEDGQYVLEFPITTGSNVEEFRIDLTIPAGVEVWSHSAIRGIGLSDDETAIEGTAPPGRDTFVFELILRETTGVQPGANLLVLSECESGRTLTTIRLRPY